MRYAIIAALVNIAAAVPLTETIYNTKVYTITSCGAEVTDCPGKKTAVPETTTSCTEGHKESYTAPPVYVSTTSSVIAPPVVSTSSAPVSSKWEKPSTSEAVKTSSVPAPPPYTSEAVKTSSAPAPPPYTEAPKPSTSEAVKTTSAVWAPSSKVTSKPVVGTGTASTGLVPYKTTSASWSATSSPAKYTGAASHLNAAGAIVGAGAFAALFL